MNIEFLFTGDTHTRWDQDSNGNEVIWQRPYCYVCQLEIGYQQMIKKDSINNLWYAKWFLTAVKELT